MVGDAKQKQQLCASSAWKCTSRLYLSGSVAAVLPFAARVLAACRRLSSASTSGGSLRLAACRRSSGQAEGRMAAGQGMTPLPVPPYGRIGHRWAGEADRSSLHDLSLSDSQLQCDMMPTGVMLAAEDPVLRALAVRNPVTRASRSGGGP